MDFTANKFDANEALTKHGSSSKKSKHNGLICMWVGELNRTIESLLWNISVVKPKRDGCGKEQTGEEGQSRLSAVTYMHTHRHIDIFLSRHHKLL